MIRHLDPESFHLFGTIFPGGSLSGKPNHHSVFLPEGTVSCYRTVAPLWLGAESGLTILSVSQDGKVFRDFCLDKTVQIKSGIWLRLTGFDGKASVQMGGISMPLSLGQYANDRDFAVRPKVRVESLYTLFYQEKEAGFLFSGEAHPMAELLYVDNGSLHSVADGQDLLLEQGDLVLYAPQQWHMQYADSNQAPCMVTIGFCAGGLCWEELSNRRFRLDQTGKALMQMILLEQSRDHEDAIFSLLTLLLLRLQVQDGKQGGQSAALSSENAIIRKTQQYVQTHVMEKLTVPAVAEGVGVSASYLTALFHKHLAISPGSLSRCAA